MFNIPGFTYGGWMTFITYITYAVCGLADSIITRQTLRQGRLLVRDDADGLNFLTPPAGRPNAALPPLCPLPT